MMRKNKELNCNNDVPLLEQEKIDNIVFNKTSFMKTRIVTISIILIAFLISFVLLLLKTDFSRNDSFNDETTDKASSNETSTNEREEPTTDVDINTENNEMQEVVKTPITFDDLYDFDESQVKEGEMAVIPMDISMVKNGSLYIDNATGLMPDIEALLSKKFNSNKFDMLSENNDPKVLIIHTHASESYLEKGKISCGFDESIGLARTTNTDKNVISVGKIVTDILNINGIRTLHCADIHDSIQVRDSYLRSEECIRKYLEKYPSIQLVIDIHRDDLITTGGDIIRPVTLIDNEPAAQVRMVVGSNWSGDENEKWEDNLSLALKLREMLNKEYINFCRPIELRSEAYNQQLSRYSMHIEIGSIGNNLDEAKTSAEYVGRVLLELLKIIPI